MEKEKTETGAEIECCFTRTSFPKWDNRLFDLDCFGDITYFPGVEELDDESYDEIMNKVATILDDITLSTINHYLAQQAPCASYKPGTSEVYVCLNHVDCVDADEAL